MINGSYEQEEIIMNNISNLFDDSFKKEVNSLIRKGIIDMKKKLPAGAVYSASKKPPEGAREATTDRGTKYWIPSKKQGEQPETTSTPKEGKPKASSTPKQAKPKASDLRADYDKELANSQKQRRHKNEKLTDYNKHPLSEGKDKRVLIGDRYHEIETPKYEDMTEFKQKLWDHLKEDKREFTDDEVYMGIGNWGDTTKPTKSNVKNLGSTSKYTINLYQLA